MSEDEDSGDKQYEPSQKKLDDARKKGDIPRSVDVTTAAAYAGFAATALAVGSGSLLALGATLAGLMARAPELADEVFGGGAQPSLGGIGLDVLQSIWPWFAVPALAALLAILAQQSFVIAGDKLVPKISRISPLSNAKNKFGRQGLFEFAKSFSKLLIFSTVLGFFLVGRTGEIVFSATLDADLAAAKMVQLVVSFVMIVLIIAALIGAGDILWQRAEHTRKNRMSRKEVTDEAKQSEGDPHMKSQRRQRAQEIALNQMMSDVPDADVIIVNPTHYAVALKWSRLPGAAPVCLAKGVDEIAARIREVAHRSGVPIHRDPATARALHATVDIGAEIRPEHYRAVAAAIRFAESMATRARTGSWRDA